MLGAACFRWLGFRFYGGCRYVPLVVLIRNTEEGGQDGGGGIRLWVVRKSYLGRRVLGGYVLGVMRNAVMCRLWF